MRMMSGRLGRVGTEEGGDDPSRLFGDEPDSEDPSGTASLRNSRASNPLLTADTEKWSFLMSLIAICWLISSSNSC